jgi:hypothetical protein
MANQYNIIGGPSKFDLMISLFDGALSATKPVEFCVNDCPLQIKRIRIVSIGREDGSGDSWNFTGVDTETTPALRVEGYYSTKNRKGRIRLASRR